MSNIAQPGSVHAVGERRKRPRQSGNGLMARIGNQLVDVIDLSDSAVKVARGFDPAKGPMEFTLFRRNGSSLELNSGVKARGQVMRVDAESVVIDFLANSYALAKMVVWHTSGRLGVAPHLVK